MQGIALSSISSPSSREWDATYDSAVPGVLSAMVGQPMMGDWTLNVSDRARIDVGKLRKWSIELKSAPSGPNLAPPVV